MSDWTDIGEQLRKAREIRHETLKDVEFALRIPEPVLTELEANDYSSFSSPTYAKSFLKQYSQYLEVDARRWLEAFESGDALANIDEFEYLHGDSYAGATPEEIKKARLQRQGGGRAKIKGAGGALISLALFLICAGVVWYYVQKFEERAEDAIVEAAPPAEVVAESEGEEEVVDTADLPDPDLDAELSEQEQEALIRALPRQTPPRAVGIEE